MIEIIIASVVWALIGLYIGSKSKSDKNLGEDNVTKQSKLIKYRFGDGGMVEFKHKNYWYAGNGTVWHHANGIGRARCEWNLHEYYSGYHRHKGKLSFNDLFEEVK
jgi:hypothetical protein